MAAVLSIELMQPISLGITLAAQAVPASEPWGAAEGCCNSIDTLLCSSSWARISEAMCAETSAYSGVRLPCRKVTRS